MEQFTLDFEAPKKEEKPPRPETLSDEELSSLYKKIFGIDPRYRSFDRNTLLAGVADPEAEKARLSELDQEEDRNALASPYRG